ncbi:uncharacterized UPF0160 family protein [Endobacter medicaginis]|uniref:MYG1 family protein n=1 Tax=Endobacter medicaginis TaxID=1181271 RepID=A0A850NRJ2_9PROT|nr:MYG1 family protein [Endobacter medicaginis]MBB3172396.1 uncharacterized UPF0160 family protein [Endobacter medicaginis]MCX5474114.1 MYG1 family protein [Endobacter medicaginis]NVN30002.1 MYG1 family protein [Endobacter medicaginis]
MTVPDLPDQPEQPPVPAASDPTRPVLVTHSGRFHCDEVFGYAILRLALGLGTPGSDHTLIRTRDSARIAAGDIVWDVGLEFDPERSRYDHHQRGAPLRDDGTPFSSAGLIWRRYGLDALRASLHDMPPVDGVSPERLFAELDAGLIRRIDESDNGVASVPGEFGLPSLIADFNLPWDASDANSPQAGDAEFRKAADFAATVLRQRIEHVRARLAGEAIVLTANQTAADPRILVFERGLPWKRTAFDHHLPVLFGIAPANNGNWMIDCMTTVPGGFDQRQPLPEAWAGLQGAALAERSGVPDAVFVHLRRFVGAARSREGAIAMARAALPG